MLKDGKLRREHIAFAISQTVIASFIDLTSHIRFKRHISDSSVTYPIQASKGSGSESNNIRPLHNNCNIALLQSKLIYVVEDLVNR